MYKCVHLHLCVGVKIYFTYVCTNTCRYIYIHVYAHIHMCEFVIPLILVSVSWFALTNQERAKSSHHPTLSSMHTYWARGGWAL